MDTLLCKLYTTQKRLAVAPPICASACVDTAGTTRLLMGAVAAVVTYFGLQRRDPDDRPLAAVLWFVLATDFVSLLVVDHWLRPAAAVGDRLSAFAASGTNDMTWLAAFASLAALADRVRHGEWDTRALRRYAIAIPVGLVALYLIHWRQRYGPCQMEAGMWGVRWLTLHATTFGLTLLAAYHLTRHLQDGEIAPAHLVLVAEVVLNILNVTLNLRPGVWCLELVVGSTLMAQIAVLCVYAGRLIIEPPPAPRRP